MKKISLTLLIAALVSSCGQFDNREGDSSIVVTTIPTSDFRISEILVGNREVHQETGIAESNNEFTLRFNEGINVASLRNSYRVIEKRRVNGTIQTLDVTEFSTLFATEGQSIATVRMQLPATDGNNDNVLRSEAKYEIHISQILISDELSGRQALKYSVLYYFYTSDLAFDEADPGVFTDLDNPPSAVQVSFYKQCGRSYILMRFNEDLQRAPTVHVKSGVIGNLFRRDNNEFLGTPYVSYQAFVGQRDAFIIEVSQPTFASSHSIAIPREEVIDLQGNIMLEDKIVDKGLFQLFSVDPFCP